MPKPIKSLAVLYRLQQKVAQEIEILKPKLIEKFRVEVMSLGTKRGFTSREIEQMLKPVVRRKITPKNIYRHPDDPTKQWNGFGRRPKWLRDLIDRKQIKSHHKLEDFII